MSTATPKPADESKLAAFFALLDKRTKEHEAKQAEERKAKEDGKLARLQPWWLDFAN